MKAPKPERANVLMCAYGKQVLWQKFRYPGKKPQKYLLFGATKEPSVIFPVSKDGKVIAVVHYRHGAQKKILELPGGSAEKGNKSPIKVGKDELKEETGYKCERIKKLGAPLWFDPASVRVRFYPLLALRCSKSKKTRQNSSPSKEEQVEPRPILLRNWFRMILKGEIVDSKSIATSMLALPYLDPDLKKEALTAIKSALNM